MCKNYKTRLLSSVLAVLMLTGVVSPVTAVSADNIVSETVTVAEALTNSYNNYISDKSNYKAARNDIVLNSDSALTDSDITLQEVNGKTALVWEKGNGNAEWNFEVSENTYYNIKLVYSSVKTGVDYTFGIFVDGKSPFDEAGALTFPRIWQNVESEFKKDTLGNELSPEQKEIDAYTETLAKSSTGVTVEPYAIYLTAGTHTLTLAGPEQPVAVSAVILSAPEKVLSYDELSADYGKIESVKADTIVIEGESAALKTSSKLIPKSDNSDAGMSPIDVMYTKLNYIGGTSWQEAGQTLSWDFTVEKSGYYSLGLRYRQSDVINAESWRWLKIDGKTPFEEAKGMRFPYCASWEFFEYGEGKEPYYIWLDEGEHTISLEVTMGVMSEYYYRLSEVVDILGNKYIEIVKITGATPDINLDYELFNQITDLNEKFTYAYEKLNGLASDLENFTGKRSSQYIAAMNNMSRVLKVMVDNPYIAHQYTGYISDTVYTSGNLTEDVWQTVEYTADIIRTGRYVYINLDASEQGAVILIDNIEVYNANDPEKTNLLTAENIKVSNTEAYTGSAKLPGTFDKQVVTRSYSPAAQTGLYMGNTATEYDTDSFTAWKSGGGSYSTDVKETMMPEIVNYKGYNYTNALKVGYSGGGLSRYFLQFRYTDTYRYEFLVGTSYTVEMKVKKLSGTLGNLYAGHGLYLPTGYISPDTYTDSDISSTEYTTLTFDYVAVNPNDGKECGGRWVFINFTSADESGVELLIDDINIYATDDETKTNMFTSEKIMVNNVSGSTEYTGGTKLLGTFDKENYVQYTDNTPEEGIVYSYDHRIANNTYGEVGQKIANTNASVTTEGNAPKFTDLGEGVKGSYAMEIGGSNAMSNYVVTFAATKVPADTKVRIEADIQLVIGSVTTLDFGIIASQTQEKAFHSVDTAMLSNRWMTFSGTQTTIASITTGTWVYFQFILTAPEGGAILRIDNIKIYADGDSEKIPVFTRSDDFNFDFDVASFTPIIKDSSESYYSASYTPSGEWQYDVYLNGETVATTGDAKLVCMENAHSGDYAVAIGYDSEQALTNYRARFGLREVLPGKKYRVSLALAASGNSFSNFSVSLSSAIGMSDVSEVFVRGNGTYGDNSVLKNIPREWTEVTFDFYEGGTMYDRGAWSYLIFTLADYSYGVGDSALFIDTVSINEIDEDGNIIGPNIFIDGDFEYISNTFDWESYESPYWSEGGATDFTFMNSIEKEVGAYACTVEDGMDIFEGMLTKEPYKYFDTYMISANKRDVMIYEATRLTQAGKKVWLGLNNIIKITKDNGNRTFKDNWQEIILAAANELQIICGNQFQGFYFDEPGYYMTDAEYIEVTGWLRETFKKRVWSVHYKDTINSVEHTVTENTNSDGTVEKIYAGSKLFITKESHQYTTDVGYWRYGSWSDDATDTLNAFKNFCLGENSVINKDTRKWIVPLTGRHAYYYQTSEQVVEIMTNMYEGMKEIPNFGGVAFYSMAYDNTTVTVNVYTGQEDPVLKAVEDGVLKCVETENVVTEDILLGSFVVGQKKTYTFLVYGGYYMLDPNDPDHVPGHDLVRAKVDDIVADFAAYNKLLAGDNTVIDDIIVVNNAGITVANLLDSMNISSVAYVKSGDTKLADGDTVKNGDILYFNDNDGVTVTYTIVKRFDLNSDGSVDAADIVRGKKVLAGKSTASALEKMAANVMRDLNTRAADVVATRNYFLD